MSASALAAFRIATPSEAGVARTLTNVDRARFVSPPAARSSPVSAEIRARTRGSLATVPTRERVRAASSGLPSLSASVMKRTRSSSSEGSRRRACSNDSYAPAESFRRSCRRTPSRVRTSRRFGPRVCSSSIARYFATSFGSPTFSVASASAAAARAASPLIAINFVAARLASSFVGSTARSASTWGIVLSGSCS